ncbi:MAG: hypothetical protein WC302_00755 [Candidatus Paceibacterota bacterium]|jgi:recombination protein RecA
MLKRREGKEQEDRAQEVLKEIDSPVEERKKDYRFEKVLSTGSTVLDLCISGGRCLEGGIPGGVLMDIFGPSASGKTSLLSEILASAQSQGGETQVQDPEARLDEEYARIYGVEIDRKNYYRPDTVTECFERIQKWNPKNFNVINAAGVDSLAALSTDLEMGPKGDKMGMRRAKEFSQELRKTARIIANNNWVICCTNQVRDSDYGEVTPGGKGIPYYASLRLRVGQISTIERKYKIIGQEEPEEIGRSRAARRAERDREKEKGESKELKKAVGIVSKVFIKKSTVDDPYRECEIYIIFNYGIDDVRGNLQYCKDMTGASRYACPDGKDYQAIEKAIAWVEQNELEKRLKGNTIDLWNEIEKKFKISRKPKVR